MFDIKINKSEYIYIYIYNLWEIALIKLCDTFC